MGRPLNKRNFGARADAGAQIAPAAYTTQLFGNAHIIKQKGSKRFLVATALSGVDQPDQICKLVTDVPAATGEMVIKCKDSVNGTYFVSKISGRTCTVVADSGTQFASKTKVQWNLSAAEAGVSVILDLA